MLIIFSVQLKIKLTISTYRVCNYDKVVELSGEGFVNNGTIQSSFFKNLNVVILPIKAEIERGACQKM